MGVADVGWGSVSGHPAALARRQREKKRATLHSVARFFELVGPCVYIKQVSYRL